MIHYPLEVEGIVTRVLQAGNGPRVVVLLHGAQSTANRWRDSLGPIADRGCTALAPDLPGRGFAIPTGSAPQTVPAFADFVHRFLDVLDIDQVVLIGASLGGHVAAQVAIDDASRVSHLVLVGPAGLTPWERTDRERTWAAYRDADRETIGAAIEHRRGRPPSWEEIEETYRMTAAPSQRAAAARLSAYMLDGGWESHFVTDALAAVTPRLPTLIVWGRDDRTFPLADGLQAHDRLAGSRMAVVDDCGHDVDLDRPALFHDLLFAFLEGALGSQQVDGVSVIGPDAHTGR